jgi:ribosomal protein S18 acetylase RimI-like enzyme
VLQIEVLDGRVHDRRSFQCGVAPLDHYFKTQAAQDMAKRVAVCYVLADDETAGAVCGFYTLSNMSIELTEIPPDKSRLFPSYPELPAILLGRLAVDQAFRGRGFGELLLIASSKVTGAAVVVVDAKGEAGSNFYQRYGFKRFVGVADRLFIPMETLEKMPG